MLAISNPTNAQPTVEEPFAITPTSTTKSEAAHAISLKLAKTITVDFDRTPLVEALQHIAKTCDVNMNINWVSIAENGFDENLPISFKTSSIMASYTLDMVLKMASTNNQQDPLAYDIDGTCVFVSTQREILRKGQTIRVYEILDLLDRALQTEPADKEARKNARDQRLQEILELIRTQTGKQTYWVEFGGEAAYVQSYGTKLIVTAHSRIQKQVHKLLNELKNPGLMTRSQPPQAPYPIASKLEKIISVDFQKTKIKTALEEFAQKIDGRFNILWPELQSVGVEPNTPISLSIDKAQAGEILNLILQKASENNPLDPLSFEVTPFAFEVATKRYIRASYAYLASYDVRDLILAHTGCGKEQAEITIDPQAVKSLLTLIRNSFWQPQWVEYGGKQSSIRELNGLLLLRAHASVHQKVTKLLEALRQRPQPSTKKANVNKAPTASES
ncbi:MAG: hypothetical protein CMJ19_08770 [Phycisphaeraceae bacterium]|nr:hypothetical protein [Phycisphaeraceae bacterium]